jgi:hypothetical protein
MSYKVNLMTDNRHYEDGRIETPLEVIIREDREARIRLDYYLNAPLADIWKTGEYND